ncbi:hypothetical protein GGG16DRAFT_68413 [Schizophyllum commune]
MYEKEEIAAELESFELSRHEWRCAEQLRDTLEYFSRADRPNLPFVIVAMDKIDEKLASTSVNTALELAIRAAARLAKHTLNRYYSLTDDADAYRISMVLHPRRKLEYFRAAGWSTEWVAEAEALTRRIYDKRYAMREVENVEEVPQNQTVRLIPCSPSSY